MSNSDTLPAPGEYLTFTLADERYALDILKVQEIRRYDGVTRVPDTPAYIRGVVNLRGAIAPVLDLRMKLGLQDARYDAFTVMIVLNLDGRSAGIVVDAVSDVVMLAADEIRPTPELGSGVDARFVSAIGTTGEQMLILLDIQSLVDWADIGDEVAQPA